MIVLYVLVIVYIQNPMLNKCIDNIVCTRCLYEIFTDNETKNRRSNKVYTECDGVRTGKQSKYRF